MADYLRQYSLPRLDQPLSLRTEADVVDAARQQLIHPVLATLQALIPGSSIRREPTLPGVRCDGLFSVGSRHTAVIEFKRAGTLERDDFQPACSMSRGMRRKPRISDGTLLGGNAIAITKQAVAYAWSYKTRYVAICDWDAMFLWKFPRIDMSAQKIRDATQGNEDLAYGTWVENRDDFRLALLGFLVNAYQDPDAGLLE